MKNVNMKNRYSKAYRGSVYTNCVNHETEIQNIKDAVKVMNATLKQDNVKDRRGNLIQYRVSLKGREAIEKAINYRTGNRISYSTRNGDVIGGLKNAGRIDIYIHRRWS